MNEKRNSIIILPINILALFLIWALLTFTNTISPQYQIRPVAEFANKIFYGGSNYSMQAAYDRPDWTYQGVDYMYWDKLISIFRKGEE